ncbi:hypothetical protein PQ743_04665 [Thermoanaerobacterium thermosaccharolyticum]|uniref:hypothetical protein n=1 Tax=Thermoanaerobacterium thermosaccharolyticum TaxID=1517 RepID=UPI003DA97A50
MKKILMKVINKEISLFELLISYLIFFITKKKIIIGSKTKIVNKKNIILNKGSILKVGTGDFGITTKDELTLININKNGKFIINGNVGIGRGTRIIVGENAILTIGNNTSITGLSKIICYKKNNYR